MQRQPWRLPELSALEWGKAHAAKGLDGGEIIKPFFVIECTARSTSFVRQIILGDITLVLIFISSFQKTRKCCYGTCPLPSLFVWKNGRKNKIVEILP